METTCDVGEPGIREMCSRNCPCREMSDPLANRWTALASGAPEGVSQRMLTRTPRVDDELTDLGRGVSAPLSAIRRWSGDEFTRAEHVARTEAGAVTG